MAASKADRSAAAKKAAATRKRKAEEAKAAEADAPKDEGEKKSSGKKLKRAIVRPGSIRHEAGTPVADLDPPLSDDEKDRLKRLGAI